MLKKKPYKILSWIIVLALILSNFIGVNGFKTVKADGTTISNEKFQKVKTTSNVPTSTDKVFDFIGITDFHGQLLDSTGTKQVGAALAKVVKDVKASNPDRTLIVGGGDLYQGTPLSNVLHGVPVQKMMTNIGMEATALGNHEFDWGLKTIDEETMNGAGYSVVCANMYNKVTNKRKYNPYKIFTKDGVKIAVIGAILKDAPTIILPANTKDYTFKDVATEVNSAAKEIRENNLADIVVATIHDGGDSLNDIVSKLSGVDVVFGGHNHASLDTVLKDADEKNVPTLNAKATGQGYIDLKVTLKADKTLSFSTGNYKPLTVNASTPIDPEVKAIVDKANEDLKPIFNEAIGTTTKALTKDQTDQPYGESQLGNWMSDVIKNYAEADVGLQNNGGIRLSPIPAGNITVGTIFYLMPFDNTICTVTMTGAQLKVLLEQAVQDNGKGIQISGIKFVYDSTKPSYKPAVLDASGNVVTPEVAGQRIIKILREKDNSALKDSDVLKVAAPDFMATGGDTFTEFSIPEIKATFKDSLHTVRDALLEDVRAKKTITVVMNNRVDNQTAASPAQEMTIAQARAQKSGTATLTGTVSTVNGKNIFMQEEVSGTTYGICVYNSAKASINKGDKIKITGPLSEYKGLLEITPASADNVQIISTGNIISPKLVTIGEINEALEGQLIELKNVTLTSIDNTASSTLQDATGTISIYKMPTLTNIAVNDKVDVIAAVSQFSTSPKLNDGYQLSVGTAADISKSEVSVAGITLNKTNITLDPAKTEKLIATVTPENAANKKVIWKSDNEAVATVDETGMVKAIGTGISNIKAITEDGNFEANCRITVTAPIAVKGIQLNKKLLFLKNGESETLIATVLPNDATNKKVSWKSSNTSIATVDENGKVTVNINSKLLLIGTVKITATTDDGKYKAEAIVTAAKVPVLGIFLNKKKATIKVGESDTLVAKILPQNATNKKVIWKSDNEKVAVVSENGEVKALSTGNAKIIVTTLDGPFKDSCDIKVIAANTIPVTGVCIDKKLLTLKNGESKTLTATVTPDKATNKKIVWKSSNPSIATVDENGKVTANITSKLIFVGFVKITATTVDGNYQDEDIITVLK
ncbi:Ig-like domain-containing protein [Clostridium sp. JS66]|uniref:Ig-like domain-containing protein n=1 Tax=Clostridium sp. JS66 TaxID=3064705 RepID=UPI00298E130A|nr:Ig-like domain-containing protein [Clostridium sp. JS66]WPC40170.1 Ig-like domain-containing protein [Clostridium sp. JS66]